MNSSGRGLSPLVGLDSRDDSCKRVCDRMLWVECRDVGSVFG